MAIPGQGGGNDTYVPTFELSGNLLVAFSRNVKKYNVNRYSKLVPVQKKRGAYIYIPPQDGIRLAAVNATTPAKSGYKWAPGQPRPRGTHNTLGFLTYTFTTERYALTMDLDQLGIDQANWPILKAHTEYLAQLGMTHRAWLVCQTLFDSTQYPSANVVANGTASGGGGPLYAGTTSDPRIKKAVDQACLTITAASGGSIRHGEIAVLMNNKTASKLSQSREIREYVMQQESSIDYIEMKKVKPNTFGLPPFLYGCEVIVEDLYYDPNNRPGSQALFDADAPVPVVGDNKILFLVRTEDLEGGEGVRDFSTAATFIYEDMKVESKEDNWDRVTSLGVTDDFSTNITAPGTGYLIQDASA